MVAPRCAPGPVPGVALGSRCLHAELLQPSPWLRPRPLWRLRPGDRVPAVGSARHARQRRASAVEHAPGGSDGGPQQPAGAWWGSPGSSGLACLVTLCSQLRSSARGLVRGVTKARNMWAIWGLRRLTAKLLTGHKARRASRGLDALLVELRRQGLTGVSDGAVFLDLMVLRRAYIEVAGRRSEQAGWWPGTGERPTGGELKELAHYARFATAAYGAVFLAAFTPRGSGSLRGLFQHIGKPRNADLHAIRRHCGLSEGDLEHFEEGGGGTFQPSWFLARDPSRESCVVLAVRGTANMDEALADCVCEAAAFEEGIAHRGFLECVEVLQRQAEGPLRRLFEAEGSSRPRRLIICGHSLGAACAVLLSIALGREARSGKAPYLEGVEIKCFTYGCPPTAAIRPDKVDGLPEVLNAAFRFDWVPRAQLGNVLRLIEAIGKVEALGLPVRTKLAFAAGSSANSDADAAAIAAAPPLLRFEDVYTAPASVASAPADAAASNGGGLAAAAVGTGRRSVAPLRPVGRCIFLYDTCAGQHVGAEVANPCVLSDGPPLLEDALRSVFDHLPSQYEDVLKRAAQAQ